MDLRQRGRETHDTHETHETHETHDTHETAGTRTRCVAQWNSSPRRRRNFNERGDTAQPSTRDFRVLRAARS